eukprot:CAMPEP_0203756688 /NCGR_PEP_ID=MMETSP0098-20131031/9904_1 /ASSEMBLY_ACC=CAM_ASM_000208 /TAXON_ID=96639 /ORGANISM=" , Strain NY0313808BC1" /LENGTH=921 /DNA_ID=CAMNT_0050648655 /DNA_START=145 /DNA_END=2911 /DNA_ORIENTATION=+
MGAGFGADVELGCRRVRTAADEGTYSPEAERYDDVAHAPASMPDPGVGLSPSPLMEDEVVAAPTAVALSPTPLYSSFSKLDPMFEMEAEEDSDYLPNVAENASCVVSSSASSQGTFCRLTDGEMISTASEQDPYILIDLENLYYVDHISFGVNVDEVSEQSKLLLWCTNSSQVDMMRHDVTGVPHSWQKMVLQNSHNFSVHVHAACSYVRLQRLSFGPLKVHNLQVFGSSIKNPEMIGCMTGHHGDEVCNNNGDCVDSRCSCSFGFAGDKCEFFVLNELLFSVCQALALLMAFIGLTCYYTSRRAQLVTGGEKSYRLLGESSPAETTRGVDLSGHDELVPCSAQPLLRSTSAPEHETEQEEKLGGLHMLFASPLIMAVPQKGGDGGATFRPIQGLNIKREYNLLKNSLKQAASNRGPDVPVSVSCATVESFHTLMTLGNVRCLHMSVHCTKDFIAFEDAAGQLHTVTMPMLRGLLRSTVTQKSFKQLRIVVLNACNSEKAGLEFVLAGVPHVVAIGYKVRDSTAATFSRAFYLALACGRSVRDAFESAREAVYSSPSSDKEEVNAFKLLPERVDHNEVIWNNTSSAVHKTPKWPRSEFMSPLPPVCDDFVGRQSDVWQILRHIMIDRRRLLVMHAKQKGMGQSQVATDVARFLHHRRSDALMKDGVYFLKCESVIDPLRMEVMQVAAMVDAVWNLFFPMLTSTTTTNPIFEDDEDDFAHCNDNFSMDDVLTVENIINEDEEDEQDHDFTSSSSSDDESSPVALNKSQKRYITKIKRKTRAKVDLLVQALVHKKAKLLLVLDGFSESIGMVEFIGKLLERVHGLRILVTSPRPFQLSHCINLNVINYHLGPLQDGDAALLLARHLNRKIVLGEDKSVAKTVQIAKHPFVKRLGGIPLDIIQAALFLNSRFPGNEPVCLDEAL